MKLEFCPYHFEHIQEKHLAYELVFPDDKDWGTVKKKTVIGLLYDDYHGRTDFLCENDQERYEGMVAKNPLTHVMLLDIEGQSVLDYFIWLVGYLNKMEDEGAIQVAPKEEPASPDTDAEQASTTVKQSLDNVRLADGTSQGRRKLYYNKEKREFRDAKGNLWITLIPCCPLCHNRLPQGWTKAEDFGGISLMGRTGGGKTTYLYSLMHNNWEMVRDLGGFGNQPLYVAAAHRENDLQDAYYSEMLERANNMCKRNGECPDNTVTSKGIPPVFLNVTYGTHKMIIGIYDNSGENLAHSDPLGKPMLEPIIDKMFAELYLFDPADLNIELPGKEKEQVMKRLEDCRIIPLEQQGDYQRQHKDERLYADEILQKYFQNPEENTQKFSMRQSLEVYNNHLKNMMDRDCLEHLKQMYFLGILIKSDLLEEVECIRNSRKYDTLFSRRTEKDLFNMDALQMRSELVREMIEEFHLFGETEVKKFMMDFGELDISGNPTGRKAVSWHCVSALGCDVEKPADEKKAGGTLKGEYAPIRPAEPLVTCIVKRIIDNHWVE